MTNAELIAHLQTLPAEAQVMVGTAVGYTGLRLTDVHANTMDLDPQEGVKVIFEVGETAAKRAKRTDDRLDLDANPVS